MVREPISFFNDDGKKLFGVFHRPLEEKGKVPSVLFFHGLAGNKCGKHRLYVRLGDILAKKGIASFRFDLTGCGDSEGEFSEASLQGFLKDGQKALDTFLTLPFVDQKRMGIFGRSFGGCLAALFAARNKEHTFKSLALWASFFSPEPWKHIWEEANDPQTSQKRRETLMTFGDEKGGEKFFEEIFSINLNENLTLIEKIPMLLIHGKKDETIPFEQAKAFLNARKKTSAPTKLIEIEEGDHDFSEESARQEALLATSSWFEETL